MVLDPYECGKHHLSIIYPTFCLCVCMRCIFCILLQPLCALKRFSIWIFFFIFLRQKAEYLNKNRETPSIY